MLNLHRLLYSQSFNDRFDNAIEPIEWQRTELERAKNAIRDHLRPRIKAATTAVLGMERSVEPKFRSQGSQRYKTCLQPAQQPPQEMDWDFGVYLPVTVWIERGPPKPMAKLYFELVERLLGDLCRERGWTLDRGKKSCVRVCVASWGHVDVPLYAASESEFERVRERVARAALLKAEGAAVGVAVDEGELLEADWDELADLAMATRDGDWVDSDPEVVTRWWLDCVAEHGPQLTRVCRYMKAWRDHHWTVGGPTSVSLMIMVSQHFDSRLRRDDIALEQSARALALALRGDVRERAIDDSKEDFNRLGEDERREAAEKAKDLADQLNAARMLRPGAEHTSLALLTAQLGGRVPQRTDLIEPDVGEAGIRSEPARQVVPPVVPATRAG